MTNDNEIIPITVMELRTSLLMAATSAMVIAANVNPDQGDEMFHRKLLEDEVEEVIKIVKQWKMV